MVTEDVRLVYYLLMLGILKRVLDQVRNGKDRDQNLSVDAPTFDN